MNTNIDWLNWCNDSCEIKEKRKSVRESERERDERSGSSQRIEATHTNHRGLSQELLAHCWDTGRTAGIQKDQAVRGTKWSEGPT